MHFSVLFGLALIAAQGSSTDVSADSHAIELRENDSCVIDGKTTVRCDQLSVRLQALHVRTDAWISLFIDNAMYETVASTLDSLVKRGFTVVTVTPPVGGTNPSSTVKHWIRLRVEGPSNHPFAMLLITTQTFKTWREELLVLSSLRYELIDRVAQTRMAQPDCKSRFEVPFDNALSITDHTEDSTRGCVVPKAESCNFLSELMKLPSMNWTRTEIPAIKHVRDELRCVEAASSTRDAGESNLRRNGRPTAAAAL